GKLKENILGSISGSDKLHFGQENFSENRMSFELLFDKTTSPSERESDCSTTGLSLEIKFATKILSFI
ncbi:hypothetical protein COW96_01315, partial [Candidatus Roizmanbacteria bacterium CG22_combo_CG10-13_8_21_14_all_33_16]